MRGERGDCEIAEQIISDFGATRFHQMGPPTRQLADGRILIDAPKAQNQVSAKS
jgi:hypothetical protein